MPVDSANIHFNEQGTPVSSDFGDVYFSNENGLEESQYVFLQHNNIPQRWQSFTRDNFVICETGFGTGLNFLLTWAAYRAEKIRPTFRLHFISTEKFPIAKVDLENALAHWPDLAPLAKELLAQYPMPEGGCHRLLFDKGQVTLDLWIGDIQNTLPQISMRKDSRVDAWYLDGFAPSKNPEMWTETLFSNMARLSHEDTTVATFTAAGLVKRGLINAGFQVQKVRGFGRKREMLQGRWRPTCPQERIFYQYQLERNCGPWYRQSAEAQEITIIGAGLAGASLALTLVQMGKQVKLYYQDEDFAQGASGNIIGGFYPHLTADYSIQSQFYALAFQFALNQYRQLFKQGYHFDHDWCGVFFPSFNEVMEKRHQNLVAKNVWCESLVYPISHQDAVTIVGLDMPYDGLFIPHGGWIKPPALVSAMLAKASASGFLQLFPNHKLESLSYDGKWQLQWSQKPDTDAPVVVIANGHEVSTIPQLACFSFSATRGQVEHLQSTTPLDKLQAVVCHKGYLTPACHGEHAMGSTYVKNDTSLVYRGKEQQQNLDTLQKALSSCDWVEQVKASNTGRAAIRCTTPDHLPLVGAVADLQQQKVQFAKYNKHHFVAEVPADLKGLYVFSGLGSRGLCTAPILAELLASQITGKHLPLSADMQAMLNPNRFMIRDLIRGK